jgi:tetratricopeptide (TPR) repeat protein
MLEEALANYQKAITISPNDEHLHFNIARIYYDIKEWNDALVWLKKSLEINPHFRDAMNFQALILKEMATQGITLKVVEGGEAKTTQLDEVSNLDKELVDAGLSEKPPAEVKKTVTPPAKQPVKP